MLKACAVCGLPSDQARCPTHRYTRPRGTAWRAQRQRIMHRDNYTCQQCGTPLTGNADTHIDHTQPLAAEGPTTDSNLRTLCAACNQAKGDRYIALEC